MRSSNMQKTLRKLSLIPIMTRKEVGVSKCVEKSAQYVLLPPLRPAPRDEQILTTPENTITYHNALCLSPQNFAQALFSVSLLEWSILHNSAPSLIFVAGSGKGGGGGGSVHRLTNSGTHILSNLQESSEMNN